MFGRLKLKYDQYRERRQYEDWLTNGEAVYQQNLRGESNGPQGAFDTLPVSQWSSVACERSRFRSVYLSRDVCTGRV